MRLWFCTDGCRDEFAEQPASWQAQEGSCPVCGTERPGRFVYLLAQPDADRAYFNQAARPLVELGGYMLVEVEADWAAYVAFNLGSGLQLASPTVFDDLDAAIIEAGALNALDAKRGRERQRQRWPIVVRCGRGWHLELVRYRESDTLEAVTYTFTPQPVRKGVSIRTGTVTTIEQLRAALEDRLPPRIIRAGLAEAWIALGPRS